jgi:hypothetical protein
MGLALDELKVNDEKMEVEGISLIMTSEVAETIRSYGDLLIDYVEHLWIKGFQLSLLGKGCC